MQGNIVPSYTHTETLIHWVGWGGSRSTTKISRKIVWLYSPECAGSLSKNHLHNVLNACRNLKGYCCNFHLFLKEQLTQKWKCTQNSIKSHLLTPIFYKRWIFEAYPEQYNKQIFKWMTKSALYFNLIYIEHSSKSLLLCFTAESQSG